MKKIKPIAYLFLIALSFSGCTSDTINDQDTVLTQQIQGKWKLTESYSDGAPANTPINNGYQIEFKTDGTFTSDEENGFSAGSYAINKTPGNNLRLIYHKSWEGKQVYKYIDAVDDQHIYLQASSVDPTENNPIHLSGFILTRIP